MKSPLFLCLVPLTAIFCIGCTTIDRGVNFTLEEPSSRQVHYRVAEGDELELILTDGAYTQLKVASVDEVSIHGEDGSSVAIDGIKELRSTWSLNLAQGTAGLMFYGIAGPLSILALPVAIPMVLLYDEDAVKNWQDDRLCRVSEYPGHYAYAIEGLQESEARITTLNGVASEIGKRELRCDPIERAERYCAFNSTTGTAFRECTALQIPREQSGVVDRLNWSDRAICLALPQSENEQSSELTVTDVSEVLAAEVATEQQRRNLDCATTY